MAKLARPNLWWWWWDTAKTPKSPPRGWPSVMDNKMKFCLGFGSGFNLYFSFRLYLNLDHDLEFRVNWKPDSLASENKWSSFTQPPTTLGLPRTYCNPPLLCTLPSASSRSKRKWLKHRNIVSPHFLPLIMSCSNCDLIHLKLIWQTSLRSASLLLPKSTRRRKRKRDKDRGKRNGNCITTLVT